MSFFNALGSIGRSLLNTTTAGSAVIAKVIAGSNVSITNTGADAGTGDVTINVSTAPTFSGSLTTNGTLTVNPSAGNATQVINAPSTSYQANIIFEQAGAPQWQIGQNSGSSPELYIYNDITGTFPLAIDATNNVITLTAGLVPSAGSATVTPIKMPSGALNSTAAAGAIEYDGTVFYSSVATSARGVIPSDQFVSLTSAYTLTSQTAAQPLFNATTNGALTLAVGTYDFECRFSLSSLSATSGSFGFALGGTATINQVWEANAIKAALATPSAPNLTFNTAANTALTAASTATTGYASLRGTIRVTAAGTVIPQVSLGVAAAAVVGAGSFFRLSPLGSSTVTNVGDWS